MAYVLTLLVWSPMNRKYIPETETFGTIAEAYNRMKECEDSQDIIVSLVRVQV